MSPKKKTTFEDLIKKIKSDKHKRFRHQVDNELKHLEPKFRSYGKKKSLKKVLNKVINGNDYE